MVGDFNNTTSVWDTQYTYGYDMLDKQGTGGTEYPLYNGQGDVFQTLKQSGTYVLSAHILDDFGQGFVAASGTEDLAYQWRASSGYRSDGDGLWTGSYNEPIVKVGARYYIPAMGVFITRDTDLSQRPYEYCNADPVNYDDPSGHGPGGGRWDGGNSINNTQAITQFNQQAAQADLQQAINDYINGFAVSDNLATKAGEALMAGGAAFGGLGLIPPGDPPSVVAGGIIGGVGGAVWLGGTYLPMIVNWLQDNFKTGSTVGSDSGFGD